MGTNLGFRMLPKNGIGQPGTTLRGKRSLVLFTSLAICRSQSVSSSWFMGHFFRSSAMVANCSRAASRSSVISWAMTSGAGRCQSTFKYDSMQWRKGWDSKPNDRASRSCTMSDKPRVNIGEYAWFTIATNDAPTARQCTKPQQICTQLYPKYTCHFL